MHTYYFLARAKNVYTLFFHWSKVFCYVLTPPALQSEITATATSYIVLHSYICIYAIYTQGTLRYMYIKNAIYNFQI